MRFPVRVIGGSRPLVWSHYGAPRNVPPAYTHLVRLDSLCVGNDACRRMWCELSLADIVKAFSYAHPPRANGAEPAREWAARARYLSLDRSDARVDGIDPRDARVRNPEAFGEYHACADAMGIITVTHTNIDQPMVFDVHAAGVVADLLDGRADDCPTPGMHAPNHSETFAQWISRLANAGFESACGSGDDRED